MSPARGQLGLRGACGLRGAATAKMRAGPGELEQPPGAPTSTLTCPSSASGFPRWPRGQGPRPSQKFVQGHGRRGVGARQARGGSVPRSGGSGGGGGHWLASSGREEAGAASAQGRSICSVQGTRKPLCPGNGTRFCRSTAWYRHQWDQELGRQLLHGTRDWAKPAISAAGANRE